MDYYEHAEEIRKQAREMMKTARYMLQDADHCEAMGILQDAGIDWPRVQYILDNAGYRCPDIRKAAKRR